MLAWGPLGVLLLSIADSAGIPLPGGVDALLIASVATHPDSVFLAALAAIAGSTGGCLLLFYLARKGGAGFLESHSRSHRARKFRAWFDRYGMLTVFIPALVPIIPLPLKVFVISAGALGTRTRTFLLVILAGRIPRYAALAYLGLQLGNESMQFLKNHAGELVLSALALFLFLAILIRLKDVRSRRTDTAEDL